MRTVAVSVALLFLLGAAAWADEADEIMADAEPLRDRWEACVASAAKPLLSGAQTAEAIADRALDRCRSREGTLRALLTRRIGRVRAGRVMEDVTTAIRAGLIRTVETLRAE